MRSRNIILCKRKGVPKAIVNVRLRGEKQNRINPLLHQDKIHEVRAADISFEEFVIGVVRDLVEIVQAGAVFEAVHVHLGVSARVGKDGEDLWVETIL